jgi:hypothetical protein
MPRASWRQARQPQAADRRVLNSCAGLPLGLREECVSFALVPLATPVFFGLPSAFCHSPANRGLESPPFRLSGGWVGPSAPQACCQRVGPVVVGNHSGILKLDAAVEQRSREDAKAENKARRAIRPKSATFTWQVDPNPPPNMPSHSSFLASSRLGCSLLTAEFKLKGSPPASEEHQNVRFLIGLP